MRDRDSQADLIRVVSCFFFIAVHTRGVVTEPYPTVEYWLKPLIIVCNPLFFMLSGKFALRPFQDNKEGYRRYYLKKLEKVIIPYFALCILIYWWNKEFQSFSATEFISLFLKDSVSYQLWFMGPMIGLLLSAPFLSILINNLSEYGRKVMIGIALAWSLISINILFNIFHLEWGYSHWIIVTWLIYFVLGYCLENVDVRKKLGLVLVCGVLCYVLTALQKQFLPAERVRGLEDHSVVFILFSISVYLILYRIVLVRSGIGKRILAFLSKRVYYIFLIHVNIIRELDEAGFPILSSLWISYLAKILTVFVLSLIASLIIEITFKGLKIFYRQIKKLILRRKRSIIY